MTDTKYEKDTKTKKQRKLAGLYFLYLELWGGVGEGGGGVFWGRG